MYSSDTMKFRIALAALVLTVAGCQTDNVSPSSPNQDIPRNAIYAKEAQGRVWYQAALDGVAYAYDADTTQLVFAAQNQRFPSA